jgi:hypothetical protein
MIEVENLELAELLARIDAEQRQERYQHQHPSQDDEQAA